MQGLAGAGVVVQTMGGGDSFFNAYLKHKGSFFLGEETYLLASLVLFLAGFFL